MSHKMNHKMQIKVQPSITKGAFTKVLSNATLVIISSLFVENLAYASSDGGHHVNWVFAGSLIFNFVAFCLLMFVLLRKPVSSFFETRSQDIADHLQAADKAREAAEAKMREYAKKIDALVSGREDEIENVRKEAEYERDRILTKAKQQAERILKDAETSLSLEVERAIGKLGAEASEKIVAEASKLIQQAVEGKDQIRLADDYIDLLKEVKKA